MVRRFQYFKIDDKSEQSYFPVDGREPCRVHAVLRDGSSADDLAILSGRDFDGVALGF